MSQNTMLYKHGGKHKIHGDNFSFIIVDADEDGAIEDRLTILDDLSELDIEVSDTDDSKGKS